MTPPTAATVMLMALAALALTACALADPYAKRESHRRVARQPQYARSARSHGHAGLASRSERSTLAEFTALSTTWTWRNAALVKRRCARLAAGRLRNELLQNAVATAHDKTLARDQMERHGRILAIAPAGRRAIVVTRETTTSHGIAALGSTAVRVYRASLVRVRRGWRVSEWASVE